MSAEKECFFVSPIGDEGSEVRERSNKLMEYVIQEPVSEFGYTLERADQMDQPGSITNQVIQKTVNSDLVIADLTGHNPNVFYELAVRHATGKPYIQLIESNESIPFDISDLRTIHYGLEVAAADQAKEDIRSQLELLDDESQEFDNPISRSAEMQSLRQSGDPSDQNLADLVDLMSNVDRRISKLEHEINNSGITVKNPNKRASITVGGMEFVINTDIPIKDQVDMIHDKTGEPRNKIEMKLREKDLMSSL